MAAGVGAHSSVTRRYIMLHTHTHTHINLKYTLSLPHTTFTYCDHTYTCTHSHTEYQIQVKLLDSEPHVKPISSVKHSKSLRHSVSVSYLCAGVCVHVCVCVCLKDLQLPRRRPARTHTRAARSSRRRRVCWTGRRSARSLFLAQLPSCRTLVCASSPSHKSPDTGEEGGFGVMVEKKM